MTASPPAQTPRFRNGPELILATKPFAEDDSLQSWWCILSTGALLIAALVGTFWGFPLLVRIPSSILAGLLLMRLFVIYHDQQHHAILPRSRLAEVLMRAFGIFALSPSSVWRSSHDHHHAHNSKLRGSHIGSYPIMTTEQFRKCSPRDRRAYLFIRHPLTILCGYVFMFVYGMCLNPFARQPREHRDGLLALVLHVAIGAVLVIFGGWVALGLTLLLPFFMFGAVGAYFFYAQHNFPGVSFADHGGWTYEKAALESSSFMHTGRVMGWFTANIAYHHVHHLNARIPFYRLPEVMQAMPELRAPKTTSLHPADIVRCLRLKVWDVATQQMVGHPGRR